MFEPIYQPWWDHPLHREATRSMSTDGMGDHGGNPTIFADRALAEEHMGFIAWLKEQNIAYWEMSAEEFEALKKTWRGQA